MTPGLYDELRAQKYLDPKYGTVSNRQYTGNEWGCNCDNPSLFSLEATLLLGWTTWPGYGNFINDAEKEFTPGLYHRFPGDLGDTSQDEIMAQSALSSLAAATILDYGERHRWVFRTEPDTNKWWQFIERSKQLWSDWKERFVWLEPFVRYCADRNMNEIDQVLWSFCCWISPNSEYGDTSGKLLFWCMITHMESRGMPIICRFAADKWKAKMRAKYPGGPRELMTVYFGPFHPFAKYAPVAF